MSPRGSKCCQAHVVYGVSKLDVDMDKHKPEDIRSLSCICDEAEDVEEVFVEWDRSYYEIGLEVPPSIPLSMGCVPDPGGYWGVL